MPDILIRNLDTRTVKRLKDRAAANRRSLQAEVKEIVEISARQKTHEELRRELEEFSKRFKGRKMADTVELLREDRE